MALGMVLCDHVIVEEGTGKVSFVGTFNKLKSATFPARFSPFEVGAMLVGSQGDVAIEVHLARLDTGASIIVHRRRLHFVDKLTEVLFKERFRDFSFPVPGYYEFSVVAEGEWVAHRRFLMEKS
jgi:hypothetical protein